MHSVYVYQRDVPQLNGLPDKPTDALPMRDIINMR